MSGFSTGLGGVGAGDAVVVGAVVTLAIVGGTVGAEVGLSAGHLVSEKTF